MSKPNTKAQKTQIIEVLKQDYFPIIPQINRNWTAKQHEENRLSRSLASFAIANLANITPPQAANSIINGENDNGIDAVYFDRTNNRLWLIQAKAGNAPNMGDNKKFCDGIRDLVHKRFQKFNSSFSRLRQECTVSNIVYQYLPSADNQDAITIEQAAIALACFNLKVMCDEIFGRANFVANVVWQKRTSPDNRLRLGDAHDNILVYFKNKEIGKLAINQLPINETRISDFKNLDNDPR